MLQKLFNIEVWIGRIGACDFVPLIVMENPQPKKLEVLFVEKATFRKLFSTNLALLVFWRGFGVDSKIKAPQKVQI